MSLKVKLSRDAKNIFGVVNTKTEGTLSWVGEKSVVLDNSVRTTITRLCAPGVAQTDGRKGCSFLSYYWMRQTFLFYYHVYHIDLGLGKHELTYLMV